MQTEWILSPGDFLANPIQSQDSEKEKRTSAINGLKCLEQFEKLRPSGSWAKMFMGLLIGTGDWYSTRGKLIWKMKGTKSNRLYFQLVVKTIPTLGKEFGILPPPTAMTSNESDMSKVDARRKKAKLSGKNGNGFGMTLNEMAKKRLLPTPLSSDCRNRGNPNDPCVKRRKKLGKQVGLSQMIDGHLNPRYLEDMMGFPIGWTELKH